MSLHFNLSPPQTCPRGKERKAANELIEILTDVSHQKEGRQQETLSESIYPHRLPCPHTLRLPPRCIRLWIYRSCRCPLDRRRRRKLVQTMETMMT